MRILKALSRNFALNAADPGGRASFNQCAALLLKLALAWSCAVVVAAAHADSPDGADTENDPLKSCSLYRAKRDGVPVFLTAATTGEVSARLALGEKVCHIGEQGDFAIIDWNRQEAANKKDAPAEDEQPQAEREAALRYVRLVELWQPRRMRQTGFVDEMMLRLRDYYRYWKHGGVPDDVYGPFRPLTEPFSGEPECQAGKLCEKIKQSEKQSRTGKPSGSEN